MLATRLYKRAIRILSVIDASPKGITAGGVASILQSDGVDDKDVEEVIRLAMEQGLVRVCKEQGGFTFYTINSNKKRN